MTTQSSSEAPAKKRLYKSRSDRVIDGVCGGLGAYLGVDSIWIRVGWVVLVLIGGGWMPVLAYIAALIILPKAPRAMDTSPERPRRARGYLLGIILVALGVLLLLSNFHFLPWQIWHGWKIPWEFLWGIFLIFIGLALILSKRTETEDVPDLEEEPVGKRHRLLRSRTDRMVGGVCGGLAGYFDVDPSLVRFGWALGTLAPTGGGSFFIGIAAYIAMLIIVPEEPKIRLPRTAEEEEKSSSPEEREDER